jgi:hypothetical protein
MTADEELVIHYKKLLEQYMKWLRYANIDREFWKGKYYAVKLENNALRKKVSKQYVKLKNKQLLTEAVKEYEDNYVSLQFPKSIGDVYADGITSVAAQQYWEKEGSKQEEVVKVLDEMIRIDKGLYEKILDRDGFAYYFNELVKLAGGK